mmetsp:Transcript_7211/g.17467  ORF Transcript_7211/g.17467 Transcript_7211/m.17467 type:complete len:237 (+) Transcript_7211:1587-2297(+)
MLRWRRQSEARKLHGRSRGRRAPGCCCSTSSTTSNQIHSSSAAPARSSSYLVFRLLQFDLFSQKVRFHLVPLELQLSVEFHLHLRFELPLPHFFLPSNYVHFPSHFLLRQPLQVFLLFLQHFCLLLQFQLLVQILQIPLLLQPLQPLFLFVQRLLPGRHLLLLLLRQQLCVPTLRVAQRLLFFLRVQPRAQLLHHFCELRPLPFTPRHAPQRERPHLPEQHPVLRPVRVFVHQREQ